MAATVVSVSGRVVVVLLWGRGGRAHGRGEQGAPEGGGVPEQRAKGACAGGWVRGQGCAHGRGERLLLLLLCGGGWCWRVGRGTHPWHTTSVMSINSTTSNVIIHTTTTTTSTSTTVQHALQHAAALGCSRCWCCECSPSCRPRPKHASKPSRHSTCSRWRCCGCSPSCYPRPKHSCQPCWHAPHLPPHA